MLFKGILLVKYFPPVFGQEIFFKQLAEIFGVFFKYCTDNRDLILFFSKKKVEDNFPAIFGVFSIDRADCADGANF